MDSVLDFLFLRRLRVNYISPPVCPVPIASASGLSFPVQSICPLLCPDAPNLDSGFLVWGIEPLPANCCTNVVCFNLYQQIGNSFVPVSQCQQPNTLVVCSAASWRVSAIFSTGVETPLSAPVVSDGINPLTIALPFAEGVVSYRVVKNGVTILLTFMSGGYEICNPPACYSLSQITSDGETCLSVTTCMQAPPPPPPHDSLNDVAAYWKLNDLPNGTRLDSIGTNHLTDLGGNFGTGGGIVYPVAIQGSDVNPLALFHADDAVLGAGPGVSFSFSLWMNNTVNLSPGRPILAKSTNLIINQEYLLDVQPDTNIGWRVKDTGGNAYQLNSGISVGVAGVSNVWHHVAFGYDSALKEAWIQVDANPIVTAPTLFDVIRTANPFVLFNFSDFSFRGLGSMSACGLWKRRLTDAEITRLYNGGAGLPLSSFYP